MSAPTRALGREVSGTARSTLAPMVPRMRARSVVTERLALRTEGRSFALAGFASPRVMTWDEEGVRRVGNCAT